MKMIISYVLQVSQILLGITGLELLFEYKQIHPEILIDFTLVFYFAFSMLIIYPAILSTIKYWDGVLGNK